MSEADVVYWVLQTRPTGNVLPRRYLSRSLAERVRAVAGTEDRLVGLDRRGQVIFVEDAGAGSVPREGCAIARTGKGVSCRTQCASCRYWARTHALVQEGAR